MNFLDATLEIRGEDMFAVGQNVDLRLDKQRKTQLGASGQREVTLGIRPSDLSFNPGAHHDQSIKLEVLVAEYIGAQSVLLCQCGDTKVTVEVNSETPMSLGQTLSFEVNPARIHLFDRESEAAL